jgi:phenylacetate-CoA ligase
VIDENGQACKPGESGRVVVTTLNNFAKPLIRYVIGDYAEVGPACSCGRGLPVINSIKGRIRSMFVRPDGQAFWPVMPNPGKEFVAKMPAVRRYQYVQKSPEWIEIRIAVEDAPYPADVEAAIIKAMQKEYGYPFHITFAYMKEITSRGRDKYEEFMNELILEAEG